MDEAEEAKLAMLIGAEYAEMQKGNFDVDFIESYVKQLLEKVRQEERERAQKIIESIPEGCDLIACGSECNQILMNWQEEALKKLNA